MSKIVFIACTKAKKTYPCPAIELYSASDYFRKELKYAQRTLNADKIYILSTLHHLIPGDALIAPYELNFADMSVSEKNTWDRITFRQISDTFSPERDELFFLCGMNFYISYLSELEVSGFICKTPLRGKNLDQQKDWLDANTR